MEKYNYIVAKIKLNNTFVKVRQKEPFSSIFVDENGNEIAINNIDITTNYFIFGNCNENAKVEESGLDGYRVIYG